MAAVVVGAVVWVAAMAEHKIRSRRRPAADTRCDLLAERAAEQAAEQATEQARRAEEARVEKTACLAGWSDPHKEQPRSSFDRRSSFEKVSDGPSSMLRGWGATSISSIFEGGSSSSRRKMRESAELEEARGWQQLGLRANELGRTIEAYRHFMRAAELRPDSVALLLSAANMKMSNKRPPWRRRARTAPAAA